MKKIILILYFLISGTSCADETLRDPMMPGGFGNNGESEFLDNKGCASEKICRGHLKMIVWKKNSKDSWVLLGNKKVKEGDYIFGNFLLTSINHEGIHFKDQDDNEYYLVISKEHDIKSSSNKGDGNE